MNELERAILGLLLAGEEPNLTVLRAQLDASAVESRKYSGVGFSTRFRVPDAVQRVSGKEDFEISDVYARLKELEHEVGFVLFVRGGKISFLESCSVDDHWPDDAKLIKAFYMHHEPETSPMLQPCDARDLAQLRKEWTA